MSLHAVAEPSAAPAAARPAAPQKLFWTRAMETRVGIIPLPVYVLLLGLIAAFSIKGKISGEVTVMIAVIVVGGFTCAEIGKRIPFLRAIGGSSLVTIFLPSFLVAHQLLPTPLVQSVTAFTKSTNFIYLFITAVVVGSILSMDRRVLIQGFAKIFIPLALGSLAGTVVGGSVGWLVGIGFWRSILYVVVPVMAGGVGEGAIPLSVGYAEAIGADQGKMLGQILPLVFFGNLVAIVICGALNTLGKRRPDLTGNGQLQPGSGEAGEADSHDAAHSNTTHIDVATIAAGGITGIAIYVFGTLIHSVVGLPAPVAMLFLVVMVKIFKGVPAPLAEGARVVFRFFVIAVTYPLLFCTAVALTPWHELVEAFHPANLVTIVATVIALVATGYYVGQLLKMYPIETAIVNACHSGLGGTGDVMILTAAERMELMPFAQVATRIGGALTVTAAIVAMAHFKVL
ncbi:2-hydroxycarboxylate transporter family protein [Methylobacterium sp. NEAU 140]|uniref:2-hydroxycarboxylate transporter family protein n=1 Tax=Methylobacterium sp. NEAU 140 TaxID=3064945 RepID=UPI00273269D2|nr:2-hydroxycarboxylate transporter family protein [Methylobacterium sp. NEAU 140]MDP4026827.1 2-hydroxycarboxylate transporter family protein [Methylobacterium sp. NEAU 140]